MEQIPEGNKGVLLGANSLSLRIHFKGVREKIPAIPVDLAQGAW
jgi:hypothetical protein